MPARHRTESRTSPRRIAATKRQALALDMRLGGATFAQIATALHFRSRQGAQVAVEAALQKTIQAPADEQRRIDIERLDAMLLAVWSRAIERDYKAIEMVLRILDRRAKLLGLDAPVKLSDPKGDPLKLQVSILELAEMMNGHGPTRASVGAGDGPPALPVGRSSS